MRIFSRSQLTYSVQSVLMVLTAVTLISCGQADVQSFKPDAVVAMQPQPQGTPPTTTFTPIPFETPKLELTQIVEREQHEAQTTAAGTPVPQTTPTPIPTAWPPPTPYWPNATSVAGGGKIIDIPRRVQGLNLETNNSWGYILDAQHMLMVQGVNGSTEPPVSDTQQGGIVVSLLLNTNDRGRLLESQDYYPTPNTSGGARIMDAAVSGGVQRVLVQTDGGSMFIFNVTTRQWERGTVLPTPIPFETPKIELTHIAKREQHEAQTAAAGTPVPRTTYTPAPTVWPPPTPVWLNATPLAKGGALVDESVHVYGVNLEANTFWGYVTDDTHFIMVKAVSGSVNPPANDVQQGGVVVEVYENLNEGVAQQSQDYYSTPNKSGGARITDAAVSGGVQRVLVQTDGGSTFIFNVTTRQWEGGTVLPVPVTSTPTPATPTRTANTGTTRACAPG